MAKTYKTLTVNELIAELTAARKVAAHVRCRSCTPTYHYGPKVLEGLDNLLCPCGQLREPYDCRTETWVDYTPPKGSMKPITPQEASQQRQTQIPDFVIDCFNKLIAKNYRNGRARVIQNEVMLEILATNADLTRQTVFDNGWLDVEEVYRAAGWRVEYDKPAYNESYDAFFVFSK